MDAAPQNDPDINEHDVVTALADFDELWVSLFRAEQTRIARLLIERSTCAHEA